MTESTLATIVVAICTALPPTLAALAALRQGAKNAVKAQETANKVQEVSTKQDEIHALVNKPMGVALEALATAKEQVAKASDSESDHIEARNARAASDLHNANQVKVDSDKLAADTSRDKIIAEYLESQKKVTL